MAHVMLSGDVPDIVCGFCCSCPPRPGFWQRQACAVKDRVSSCCALDLSAVVCRVAALTAETCVAVARHGRRNVVTGYKMLCEASAVGRRVPALTAATCVVLARITDGC